jgi:hypothetical protein
MLYGWLLRKSDPPIGVLLLIHPEISGFGSEPVLELQEAYSVMDDRIRRAVYDRKAKEIPIRRTGAVRPGVTVRRPSAETLSLFDRWAVFFLSREAFHPACRVVPTLNQIRQGRSDEPQSLKSLRIINFSFLEVVCRRPRDERFCQKDATRLRSGILVRPAKHDVSSS